MTLAKAMFKKDSLKSKNIIKYGDVGDEYYVLANGQVKVTVYVEDADPNDPNL